MAIKKPYSSSFGVVFPDAYWMIASTSANKMAESVEVEILVYPDEQSRNDPSLSPVNLVRETLSGSPYSAYASSGLSAVYNELKNTILQGGIDV